MERYNEHRCRGVLKNSVGTRLPLFPEAFLPKKSKEFMGLRHRQTCITILRRVGLLR
jgi:hypothetical protein